MARHHQTDGGVVSERNVVDIDSALYTAATNNKSFFLYCSFSNEVMGGLCFKLV